MLLGLVERLGFSPRESVISQVSHRVPMSEEFQRQFELTPFYINQLVGTAEIKYSNNKKAHCLNQFSIV